MHNLCHGYFRQPAILFLAVTILLLPLTLVAQEYGFDTWTTANGLPQNTVTGVVQTPDGYLWLSTFDGLARFDGVRFTIFDKGNTKGIINNRFARLFADREGTLYALTENHTITVYRNGTFTSYSQLADSGEAIAYSWLKGDKDGNAIIETDKAEYYLQNGELVPIPEQKVREQKQTYFGKSGAKWVFEPNQISRTKDGEVTTYQIKQTTPELHSSNALHPFEDKQGALWIYKLDMPRLVRLRDGIVTNFTEKDIPAIKYTVYPFFNEDDDGSVVFLFSVQDPKESTLMVKFKDDRFTSYQIEEKAQPWGDGILDREGNMWYPALNGLKLLRRELISNLSVKDGLNNNEVYPILETNRGEVFIGSINGLNRYEDGKLTNLGKVWGPGFTITSGLFSDADNRLWAGFIAGLGRYEDGELKKLGMIDGSVTDFTSDGEGNIWISVNGRSLSGLLKYKDDKEIKRYTVADGLPSNDAVLTHQDRNGNLWAGTFDGIAVLKGDRFTDFKQEPNSPKGYIREIYEDADGVLWFGTYGDGLYRYKDGKFFNYRVEHGLFNNGVFAILEDERGNFWMSSNRGIHRVSKQELNDFADGKIPKLNSVSYDEKDGMLNAECNGGRIPAAIKTKDGKLWFGTMGGVAIVDPNAEKVNPNPPPVVIENISIDRKVVELTNNQIELQPGQSNIHIEYTGLSLTKSEQVKFRYKLEGLEESWVEAGTKRAVDYSYLPAGSYTFHVIAANANGIWNNESASVKIVVHPYFYKTWWFIGLVALIIGLLIWWAYYTRVSGLEAIAEAKTQFSRQLIESQEAERKRIASELHDGLGQSLVVIKNRALLGIKKGDDKERVTRELDTISESASHALDEVREITNNLRPQLLDRLGLTKAIIAMLKKVSDVIAIESEIDLIDGIFNGNDEISIYRIIQESLNNAIKHSNASDVVVKIKRNEGRVLITIEDNGRGFDTETATHSGTGLGLVGLRERVQLLNGEFEIDSEIGKGTKIRVSIEEGNG